MKLIKNKKGFSFLEVMVTIAVLSVGILAVLTLMTSSMRNSMNSRNSIIASELAQEGIELARNIRDNNLINGNNVFSANFPASNSINCRIDKNSTNVSDCNNGLNHKKLYFNSNFYNHTVTANATKFQRKLMIDYYNSAGASTTSALAVKASLYSVVIWGTSFPSVGSDVMPATRCNACNASVKCVCVKDVLTERD